MVSALLWLTGIQPFAFNMIASAVGANTLNSTDVGSFPNITTPNQTITLTQMTTVDYSSSTFLFGILVAVGLTGLISTIVSIVASGYSVVYLLPAAMIVTLLLFLLSPITTMISILLVNQYTFAIGIILLVFFLTVTMLGVIEFIRGGEL